MFAVPLEQEYFTTTDAQASTCEAVWELLRQTHWAANRSLQTVRISMQNSFCFYLMTGTELAGFARVITDFATFAYLCDVVVAPRHRGKDAGTLLIHSVLNHPSLKGIPQWRLKTTYAADFYRQFGFTELEGDITHMEYFPNKR